MSGQVLFIGETLVDLICEGPVEDWSEADSFVPHCGGAPTNAAIVAARCGAEVALGGGVGDDGWGRLLEARLRGERIDLRWWVRLPGVQTAVAFVVIDAAAVPDFVIYGQGIEPALEALGPGLEEAVSISSALVLGSNTLIGMRERAISARARELALAAGKPLVFNVNLRAHRWREPAEALEVVRSFCRGALIVKLNAEEASLLTGESDPARAADSICAGLEARLCLVTLGAAGALVSGEARARAGGVRASVVDTTGAGDAITGVLVAALAGAGFDPQAVERALPRATEIAARSTEGYGATDALPRRL